MVVICGVHTHACTGNAVFAESDSGDDRFFGKCSVAVVAIKLVRLSIIRKQKIGPAVIVVIEHGDTESFRSGVAETGSLRQVFKGAVAAIMPETNGSSFVGFRRAIRFAFAVKGAIQVGLRGPLDIIGDDEIEMSILVVVNPRGAGAEFLGPQEAGFLRDIRESAVAVVVKKVALAVGSDKKIVIAVVVVVTNRYAHSEHFDVEPSFVRHVGERTVMIVVIELGRGVLLNVAGPVHAIYEKHVRPAVVVIVDE